MLPIAAVLDRGDRTPIDIAAVVQGGIQWTQVVPGGFGSASFNLDGDPRYWRTQIPYLAILRLVGDSGRLLFEGQVEDIDMTLSETGMSTVVRCFGLQNELKEQSVRRVWSKRDMRWQEYPTIADMKDTVGGALTKRTDAWNVTVGQFDPTDPTKGGAEIRGTSNAITVAADLANGVRFQMPAGVTLTRIMGSLTLGGANVVGELHASANGSAFGNATSEIGASGSFSVALPAGTTEVRLSGVANAGYVMDATRFVQWYGMRLLGTSIVEDASGGFYGDTLIRDLLTLVPGLGAGVLEVGSDFTIPQLDASVRRAAYDVLAEIAGYYTREWGVWDGGLLDWKTPNLSETQWTVPLASLSALQLDGSVNNSKRTTYVLYTDAASGLDAEQSTASIDRRNPYVLNGRAKDAIVTPGFPMTSNTGSQLSAILSAELGSTYVPLSGTITVNGERMVGHASGATRKAWEIRAGENVTVPDLPISDLFASDGRGETTFHIVSVSADTGSGDVALSVESFGKRADVLLARLSAVTRVLVG